MQWSLWPQNKCPFSNSALLIRQLNYNSFGLNGPVTTGVHLQTPSLNSAFPPTPSQSAHIHDRPEGLIYGIYNQVISFKEQTRSNIAVCSAFSRSSDLNGGKKKKRKGRSRGAAPVTTQPLGPFPGGPDVLWWGKGRKNPLQSRDVRGSASSKIRFYQVYFLPQHGRDPSPLRLSSLLPLSSSWHVSKQRIVAAFIPLVIPIVSVCWSFASTAHYPVRGDVLSTFLHTANHFKVASLELF